MIKKNIEMDIKDGLKFAEGKFPEYNSYHEGYGIILEEMDELWDEVKEKDHNELKLYREASHVAVTAIRFMKLCKRDLSNQSPTLKSVVSATPAPHGVL